MKRVGELPGKIGVDGGFLLFQVAHVEVTLGRVAVGPQAEALVDGVVEDEIDPVLAVAGAEVEQESVGQFSPQAPEQAGIPLIAVEERREPPGKSGESEFVTEGAQGNVIGSAIEETIAVERIGIVALRVCRRVAAHFEAGIEEKAQILALGAPPGMHERRIVERRVVPHAGHSCVDQRLGARPLNPA